VGRQYSFAAALHRYISGVFRRCGPSGSLRFDLSNSQKQDTVKRLTATMVAIEGENMRPVT
jgi:hypothetical protein